MLTKYGTDNIIVMLAISAALIITAWLVGRPWISWPLGMAGVLFAAFTLWFFRDPDRTIPPEAYENHTTVLSPADGRVVQIIDTEEKRYIKDSVRQISIFLSPLDVHVNRSPVTGVVEYFEYNKGDYLVAYHPKSSELNEQTYIGVKTAYGKVLFKQIVGILARRLVFEIDKGDSLVVGEKFGMMKFGSRMDILIDPQSEILVKEGDRVIAGETILANLPRGAGMQQP
ncbi:MAG: phosphatidylserine decarboxylase [Candidatus Kapaibacterium sp.]